LRHTQLLGNFFLGGILNFNGIGFIVMNRKRRMVEDNAVSHRDAWRPLLVAAFILSLLAHWYLQSWAKGVTIERKLAPIEEKTVKPTFKVERVDITPRVKQPKPEKVATAELQPSLPNPQSIPEEKASFEKMMGDILISGAPPRLDEPLLEEKPGIVVAPASAKSSTNAPQSETAKINDSLAEELLKDIPNVQIDASSKSLPATTSETLVGLPLGERGFSNLDDLLAQTGPLTSDTAPILMPSDLLFTYDAFVLEPGAMSSLEKLGILLKRNPRARFLIEGHTDSFGTDDYNLKLSHLRAESVKAWLITSMGLPGEVIETVGLGETRLIAPPTGTIDEQRINRRVEIVIRDASP
jgi:outer membrane protein OmpA-like peptidoglycan-associated protein